MRLGWACAEATSIIYGSSSWLHAIEASQLAHRQEMIREEFRADLRCVLGVVQERR